MYSHLYSYFLCLGYRMPPPEGTPDEIYRLMLRCWEYQPENRPHFDHILAIVEALLIAYR